jgi:hypothetical protein
VPSFTEALYAFESVRVFIYAHDITKWDQVNVVNIEMLLFSLKGKGATKQMRINDFFKKKSCKLDLTMEVISLVYVFWFSKYTDVSVFIHFI